MTNYNPEHYYESILKICKKILDTIDSLEEGQDISDQINTECETKNELIKYIFKKNQSIPQIVSSISLILCKTIPLYEKVKKGKRTKTNTGSLPKLSKEEMAVLSEIMKVHQES